MTIESMIEKQPTTLKRLRDAYDVRRAKELVSFEEALTQFLDAHIAWTMGDDFDEYHDEDMLARQWITWLDAIKWWSERESNEEKCP